MDSLRSFDPNLPVGEMLRRSMRCWATGVSIVTSTFEGISHGMTVNSFGSISLAPPLVTVTMNNDTRTYHLVQNSGIFAVTVLSQGQQALAELFSGRIETGVDRMAGLDVFTLETGSPLIAGGMAYVDCRVVQVYPMLHSNLFIGEVVAARPEPVGPDGVSLEPLIYFNRRFTRLLG